MQVVLDTRGLSVSVRNQCFQFKTESETRMLHPSRVTSILITAPCRISSPALQLAAVNQIPVTICNHYGAPVVRTWSPHFINTSKLRRNQYLFTRNEKGLAWLHDVITRKIEGQIRNLVFIGDRKSAVVEKVDLGVGEIREKMKYFLNPVNFIPEDQKKHILYIEAFAAGRYWPILGSALEEPWAFINRVKRNPADPFNASLNYLYGILRNQIETAVLSIGLDPALGVLHRDGYQLPSLIFDMMEPFRPIVDRILIQMIFDKKVDEKSCFDSGTTFLCKEYRKKLIGLMNEKLETRMQYRNSTTFLKNHILSDASELAKKIQAI